jgi:hypothetical protein
MPFLYILMDQYSRFKPKAEIVRFQYNYCSLLIPARTVIQPYNHNTKAYNYILMPPHILLVCNQI